MAITATITTLNYSLSAASATSITATAKAGGAQLFTTSTTESSKNLYLRSITMQGYNGSGTLKFYSYKGDLSTLLVWQEESAREFIINIVIPATYAATQTVSGFSYTDTIKFKYAIEYSYTATSTTTYTVYTSEFTATNPIYQEITPTVSYNIYLNNSNWSGKDTKLIAQNNSVITVTNVQCTGGRKYDGTIITPTSLGLAHYDGVYYNLIATTTTMSGGSITYTMPAYTRGSTQLYGIYVYYQNYNTWASRGYPALINQLPESTVTETLVYEPGATSSVEVPITTTDNDTSQTLSVYGTIDSGSEQLLISNARGDKTYTLDTSSYTAATGSDITLQYRAYDGLEYSDMKTVTISKDSGYVHYSTSDYGKVNYYDGSSWQEADQVYIYNNGWQLSIK